MSQGIKGTGKKMVESTEKAMYSTSYVDPAHITEDSSTSLSPKKSTFLEKWLIFPKVLYFLFGAVIFSTQTFYRQYLILTWSLTSEEIFVLPALLHSAASLLGNLTIPFLADRTGKNRLILSVCAGLYCICSCLFLFPAWMPTNDSNGIDDSLKVYRLYYFFGIQGFCRFLIGGIYPLLDTIVLKKLASDSNLGTELLARQRFWLSIGHIIVGTVVQNLFILTKDLKTMFYTLIFNSILFIVTIIFGISEDLNVKDSQIDNASFSKSKMLQDESKESGKKSLFSSGFLFFLGSVFVAGFIRIIMTMTGSSYMTEVLNYDKSILLESTLFKILPEALFTLFFKEITASLGLGVYWAFIIGQAAGVIRMFGYTLIPINNGSQDSSQIKTRLLLFAFDYLKGLNASFVSNSSACIAYDLALMHLKSTGQGLSRVFWEGLPFAISFSFLNYMFPQIQTYYTIISIIGGIYIGIMIFKFSKVDRVILNFSQRF